MAHILVVDGDENIAFLLEQNLLDAGHEATLASNGADALLYLNAHRPNLIILDKSLPEMVGSELLQTIRCRDIALPVIIYSGYTDFDDTAHFPSAAYVLKSGDFAQLNATINRLLSGHVVDC